MIDTYNVQIEALMTGDYRALRQILPNSPDCADNHYEWWSNSGHQPGSLFEFLPENNWYCASTIEHADMPARSDAQQIERIAILCGASVSLPDLADYNIDVPDKFPDLDMEFTRDELEEFARRQRIARK